jgi:hypothetical protein
MVYSIPIPFKNQVHYTSAVEKRKKKIVTETTKR